MVNYLYFVMDITFIIVLSILLAYNKISQTTLSKSDKAYEILLIWVIVFCLQDAFWGIFALMQNRTLITVSSTLFHLSTVTTTYLWLNFVLTYLDKKISHPEPWRIFGLLIVLFQIVIVSVNLIHPMIFSVSADGIYTTEKLRPLAFWIQESIYIVIAITTLLGALKAKSKNRTTYFIVFCFVAAPVAFGLFQLQFPEAPFHAIGYFIGCVIINLFVISRNREEYIIRQSNTDKLTTVYNRKAYEERISQYPDITLEKDFVLVSMDVNGLKYANDSYGHVAGDEIIRGAALCMKMVFSKYGEIYRIGGDEFAAILHVPTNDLSQLKVDFEKEVLSWSGDLVKHLSISAGYVEASEFPENGITDIIKIADKRMYTNKSVYYSANGRDRRVQQDAFIVLCESYTKILKINLTANTYSIIQMKPSEQNDTQGFGENLSSWLEDFATAEMIHPDSIKEFCHKTSLDYLKNHFAQGNNHFSLYYKRMTDKEYKNSLMEIVLAPEYTHNNQVLFLYVKNIEFS